MANEPVWNRENDDSQQDKEGRELGHDKIKNPGFPCLRSAIFVHDEEEGTRRHQFPEEEK